ncbi:MAG: hypothetical protein IJ189_01570 [Clostridia bacterium]|nr:hypothetical protein [Clostridia bacterium]
MKKKCWLIIGIIIVLALVYFWGPGFTKNTAASIIDYSVSKDGKAITIKFGVASSTGFIRDAKISQQHGGKLYLDCYSAFGGINGSIGAEDTFTFPLNEETSIIAVYRNKDAYEEVLVKAEDGTWQRSNQ